ncbi:glycosyltransferase [Agrococcus terreus]|uniref:glycosyltransferase n=1 Tax=Agrococcus terreus TaxID=574649 RepID=UPI00385017C8
MIVVDDDARRSMSPAPRRLIALGHYPDNPWQQINYADLDARGVAVDLRPFDDDLDDVGSGDVVHVNWTAPLSQLAADSEAADAAVLAVIARLRRATIAGARLLWTIHNRMPHELEFASAELMLQRAMAAMADGIHVMNERSAERMAPDVRLPANRVIHIPHPSYVGWYPSRQARSEARAALGLPDDSPVVVSVGALRGYKGLRRLVAAFDVWKRHQPSARLVVGGRPGGGADLGLLAQLQQRSDITVIPEHLDDDLLCLVLSAANAMALPYADGLNSGVVALGATFGLPVVMADIPAAEPYRGLAWLRTFRHGDDWLVEAAADSSWLASGPAADETAAGISPAYVAERFATTVVEMLDSVESPAGWRSEAKRVGIVVVNYRSSALLPGCLGPLVGQHSIVVVDSHSDEEERREVERWTRDAGIAALLLDDNPGFGAAANAGARLLLESPEIEAILFLNPDVVADRDAVASLSLTALSAPSAMVSATITTSDGRTWFEGGVIDLSRGLARHRHPGEERCADWLTAACLIVPRDAMEEGFPPGWFLYYEDVALTYSWRHRGGQLLVDPIVVAHAIGGTQATVASLKSFQYSYWNARNRLRFAGTSLGGRNFAHWLRTTPQYVDELVARASPTADAARVRHRIAAWRGVATGGALALAALLPGLRGR